MQQRTVEQVESWPSRRFSGGYDGLRDLASSGFSGAIDAGPWLFMLNGRLVGVFEGDLDEVEDASGTAYTSPDQSLPLLFTMLERGGEQRAEYYTGNVPLEEVDETLSDGRFTGYVELSENVLSGDYYVVYYGGNAMSCAFVGNARRLKTGDEAFGLAADEVGIYTVNRVDVDVIDIPGGSSVPDTDDAAGGTAGAAGAAGATGAATAGAAETDEEAPSTDSASTGEPQSSSGAGPTGEPTTGTGPGEAAQVDETTRDDASEPSSGGTTAPTAGRDDPLDLSGAMNEARGGNLVDFGEDDDADSSDGQPPIDLREEDDTDPEGRDDPGDGDDSTSDDGSVTGESSPDESGTSASAGPAPGTDADASGSRTEAGPDSTPGTTDRSSGPGESEAPGDSSESGETASTTSSAAVVRDIVSDDESDADPAEGGDGTDAPDESDDESVTPAIRRVDDGSADSSTATAAESETGTAADADGTSTDDPGAAGADDRSAGTEGPADAAGTADEAETGDVPERSGTTGAVDATAAVGDDEAAGESGAEPQTVESTTESAELERLRARAATLEQEREELREELRSVRTERDEAVEERTRLETELERLRDRIEKLEAGGAAATASRSLSADEALAGTNLFVRYETKSDATLEEAHEGGLNREALAANLDLEYHTTFEDREVTVDGMAYETFLQETLEHRFVSWVVEDLVYEIRDTDHAESMRALYDVLPDVDRAELYGTVSVEDPDAGEAIDVEFDVVFRDRLGNPLVVVNLLDSRDPAPAGELNDLLSGARAVGEAAESLVGAFLVTTSFFEPEALEAADAAADDGGLLSSSRKASYVKLGRKRGFHLCLVEGRERRFHVVVPEL